MKLTLTLVVVDRKTCEDVKKRSDIAFSVNTSSAVTTVIIASTAMATSSM